MNDISKNNNNNETSSEFVRSVFELSSDDIAAKEKKQSPLSFVSNNLRFFVILLCVAVLIWSGQYIINSLIHYKKADNIYENIGDFFLGVGNNGMDMMLSDPKLPTSPNYDACQGLSDEELNDIISAKPVNAEYERIKNKLYTLRDNYPDLYGWIVLPNTPINYPIMQYTDNDFYLTHSYDGRYLGAGSIFADYHCDKTLMDNYNLVLYGHHMSNSSMFHSLDKFLDEDFFRNNNTVYVYTIDGMYTYKVISVYATNKYYPYIQTMFTSVKSFTNFAERVYGNSIYKVEGIEFDAHDRLLTLSTCSNRTDNGRLAVHAILESYTN